MKIYNIIKKTILLVIAIFSFIITSCSSEDANNEKNSNESKINVTINGTEYRFNTFTFEKHFEDPNDKYYYVTAKIDNKDDLVIEFDVTLGLTADQGDNIIGEFNLHTRENNNDCSYYAPDTPYPDINVTANNEEEFIATLAFSNGYGVYCNGLYYSEDAPDAPFGNEVTYTNGSIYLDL
ncbi:hypothetical protein SAMN05444483_102332 [Salegentibacter echinorum]|uniref:DUF4352 domain-containing protein n=1 Tax=Salegentibacter echinorum TaxID=1073325 RepID=A0A1M5EDI7_SALEC|nr:hypothetical protein [Salegentibacter echinorum]SHF77275.1 hypothetical protein SAMN05444483_102332 [Salegentibacter echinorum]